MAEDDADDIELEFSPLGGPLTIDGTTVAVLIYRGQGTDEGWILEVEDEEGGSTLWDEPFDKAADALAEVRRVVNEEGIRAFVEGRTDRLH